jgi:hypothetical protein
MANGYNTIVAIMTYSGFNQEDSIMINKATGVIEILNDGNGIEIVKHGEYDLWIPELIFGELLTSSNYNDDIVRTVGGVNGLGITVTLGDALTVATTGTTILSAGTLALNNFTLSTGIFNSNNSTTRSISFGSGNIAMTNTTAGTTVLAMATVTNFTWTGTGGFTRNQVAIATLQFGSTAGGTVSNAPNLSVNAGGTSNLVLQTGSYFKNVNFTGSTCTASGGYNACGNLTLASGAAFGAYSTLSSTFITTATITSNGKELGSVTINASGIVVTLADAMFLNTLSPLTLTQGTFDAANFNVTTGNFSSSGASTRTLNMGSGTWAITGIGATAWNTNITAGLTFNPSTSTITMTSASTSGKTFVGGGLTYYNLNQGGAGTLTISGNNTFNTISSSVTTADTTVLFTVGSTQTVTNFNFTGTAPFSTILQSPTSGSTFTLSKSSGTVNVTRCLIRDSIATGGATWNATESRNIGNNTGWNITAPANPDRYWVGGTASWDGTAGTKWALTSGGSGGATMPGRVDNAVLDGASGVNTVTIAAGNLGVTSLVCTGFTGTLAGNIDISIYGNVTLGAGSTVTYTGTMILLATATITCAGKTLGGIEYNSPGNTLTLGDACTVGTTSAFNLTAGTLNLNGFTLSTGSFGSNNSNTRAIAFGSANIALTSTTASSTVLLMNTVTNFSWTGTGGFTRNMAATATVQFGITAGGSVSNAPNLTVNAGASALTIATNSWFKNLVFTGSTSTVTAAALNMAGNLTLASGGTYTAVVPTFLASGTVTSAGRTLSTTTINGSGITVTLADAMTLGISNAITLTAGTLDLAGFTLSTGIFSSNNSNTRAITFGSGNIALTSTTAATTVLQMNTVIGFSWTGTGGFTRNMAATATVQFGSTAGGTVSNAPNLTVNAGVSALTITSNSWFDNVNFTGSTSTVTASALNMAGNLTLASGGTYTSVVPTFVASGTVTSAGRTLGNTTINGSGITVTLADAMTVGPTNSTTLTAGTLNLAGFTLSTGTFVSTNSNTRAIAFGSGNIALTSTTAATTVLNMQTATFFSFTGTGGFTRNQAATATVVFGSVGGTVSNAPNLSITAGASALTITTDSWFKNVDFTGSTCTVSALNLGIAGNLTLAIGGTYTGVSPIFRASGTVTSNGKTFAQVQVTAPGGTVTLADAMTVSTVNTTFLNQGTLNLAGFTLSVGVFDSNNSNTRSINFGAGGTIALATTTNVGTILSMATAIDFTWTGTGGFTRNQAAPATVEFGSTAGGTVSNAPNLTVNAGTSQLTITSNSWFKNLDFTGTTNGLATGSVNMAGNLTLDSDGTYTSLTPTFLASGTITSAGRALGATTINGSSITVTLADALQLGSSGTGTLTLTQGAFNAAGFNVSIGTFSSSNTNTRTLSMGSGTWTIYTTGVPGATVWNIATSTNMTLNPSTSTINLNIFGSSSPYVFSGGGLTYYNLRLSRADAFSGSTARIVGSNAFNNITNTSQPLTFQLTAGTTQTVSNFDLSGTAGNLVTINSTTGGSQATLSKASGTVNAQYLAIQDSIATGGATWNALFSTNLGNNIGWIFSGPGGNMFLMFI